MAILHCIYDPYCGWCYAAAPLIVAARSIEHLEIELHGGGMMAGNNRQQMTPQLRDFILQHDQRIIALTRQPFGEAYSNLLRDTSLVLDSTPPTMAIVASAAHSPRRALDMLDRIQRAHFIEGRLINQASVLCELAEELGLDRTGFAVDFASAMQRTGDHMRDSRELLKQSGGRGFPTFLLEVRGSRQRIEHAHYLGRPGDWREAVKEMMADSATVH
jgi:putative protein-disulfide isomerase